MLDVHQVAGALDLVVGCSGKDIRVEIKDGSKPPSRRVLTVDEEAEFREWRGARPQVVESRDDVHALVNRLRRHLI